jgi:dsDNA-specific endonuclease/ATPase MutS2
MMGKRKRRLHSPKYANKYASVRASYTKLRNAIEAAEADGKVTQKEAETIKEIKEQVVAEAVNMVSQAAQDLAAPVIEKAEKIKEKVAEIVSSQSKKKTTAKHKTRKRTSTKKTSKA